ncbi:MAG: hypothetical protein ACLQU3_30965 [Limisphaerales bacterium]
MRQHLPKFRQAFALCSDVFVASTGVAVWFCGVAKLISGLGTARALEQVDVIFHIRVRLLLFLVASIEFLVVLGLITLRSRTKRFVLIQWLSLCFLIYRLGLRWLGFTGFCPCLGTVTERLPFSPKVLDSLLLWAVLYMLIGSTTLLAFRRKAAAAEAVGDPGLGSVGAAGPGPKVSPGQSSRA